MTRRDVHAQGGQGARRTSAVHPAPASSTNRHTALTSRICSIVLQSTSSNAGAHTSTAWHWAREVARTTRVGAHTALGSQPEQSAEHRHWDGLRLEEMHRAARADDPSTRLSPHPTTSTRVPGINLAKPPNYRLYRQHTNLISRDYQSARWAPDPLGWDQEDLLVSGQKARGGMLVRCSPRALRSDILAGALARFRNLLRRPGSPSGGLAPRSRRPRWTRGSGVHRDRLPPRP
jgi:hypothetical protein